MNGEVETVGQTETPSPDDSSNVQPPASSSHEPGPPAPPAPPGDQPSEGATSADQPAPPGDQPPHPTYSSTTPGLSEPTSDDPPSSSQPFRIVYEL